MKLNIFIDNYQVIISKVYIEKGFQILMIDLLLHNRLEKVNNLKEVIILLLKDFRQYKKIMILLINWNQN